MDGAVSLEQPLRLQFGLASYITAENRFQLEPIDRECLEHYFKIYLGATPGFIKKVYQDWYKRFTLGKREYTDDPRANDPL